MTELRAMAFDHDGTTLVGQIAIPEKRGPHPAVMVMHTAHGLSEMMRERVRRLSDIGYIAVAADICSRKQFEAVALAHRCLNCT